MSQSNNATKDDLKKLEINLKSLIEELAEQLISAMTKGFEDINKRMATKEELKEVEKRLETKINQVEEKVDDLTTKVVFLKDDINVLKADTPTDKQFKNHETRISKLEKTVFA